MLSSPRSCLRPALAAAIVLSALTAWCAPARAAFPATPSATTEANHANAKRGISVATAGDVNGDGYSDVIFSDDGAVTGAGAAYVYLGGPGANLFDPSRLAFQKIDFSLGPQVAGIGDANGDGYDDIAIVWANNIRIYYGKASGVDTVGFASKTFTGYVPILYPIRVSPAGDVNGDGYADMVLGFPEAGCGGSNSGSFTVFYGSASGINLASGTTFCGSSTNAYLGSSVGTAGDVNADGFADVIAGAYGDAVNGRAYVYLGSAAGLAAAGRVTLAGDEAGCQFGAAVATAGDVNGDGFADVIVGAPGHDYTPAGWTDAGAAYVFLGSASSVSTTASWYEYGPASGTRFGNAVATAGDLDGDGYADVLVGGPSYTNPESNEGGFAVFPGSGSGVSPANAFFSSNVVGAQLGGVLGTAGDVNGDGFSDLLIAAPYYTNGEFQEGQVRLYLGSADLPNVGAPFSAFGSVNSGQFGAAVSSGGDFNGDGWPDLIVGEPGFNAGGPAIGRASLLLGGPFGPATSAVATYSPSGLANTGAAVSLLADINGDGLADAVVGLPSFTGNNGAVVVFYGNGGSKFIGTTGKAPIVLSPSITGGRFGSAVAVGDFNGDGYADVAVGSPASGGNGQVFVYLSRGINGLTSLMPPDFLITGPQAGALFGNSLAVAGDVNRDGYQDLVVGSPNYTFNGGVPVAGAGRVTLYRGLATGLDTVAVYAVHGTVFGSQGIGASVAGAGDVDGDGYSDFLIGAPTTEQAILAYGGPTYVRTTVGINAPASGAFGACVAGAGDIDGDGLSDILVGAPNTTGSSSGEGRMYLYRATNLTTAAWTKDGGQVGAALGSALASADFNGDGYSDVVGGAPNYDITGIGNVDGGYTQTFLGNGYGLYRSLGQRNGANNNSVAPYGSSGSNTNFWIGANARSASGRTKVRLEWRAERCAYSPLVLGGVTSFVDTGPGGLFYGSTASFNTNIAGLDAGVPYAWSGRYRTQSIYFPRTPWFTANNGGVHIYDLRTTGSSLAVDLSAPVSTLELSAPRPNPARGPMTLACALPRSCVVEVAVLDLQGRHVRMLATGTRSAGRFEVTWDGRDEQGGRTAPGIYFVRMRANGEQATQRVVRLE